MSLIKCRGKFGHCIYGHQQISGGCILQELVACMALENSVARLHRQPVSVLRTMAQHASVGDGGLSPSTAGKHTDKEDKELVHDPPAATPLKHPSTTRITATSATNAPIFEENFNGSRVVLHCCIAKA